MEIGIILEELQRANRLCINLAKEVDVKNQRLFEVESKHEDTVVRLGRKIAENDGLRQAFDDEMKRVELIEQENNRLKWELECQTRNIGSLKHLIEKMKHDCQLLQLSKVLKHEKSQDYLEPENMPVEDEELNVESMVKVKEAKEIRYEENLDSCLVYRVRLCEMERKYDETCAILVRKIAETDRLHQAFSEDLRTVELIGRQNKKLKYELECTKIQRQGLVKRVKELEKQKSQVYLGQKPILAEKGELNDQTTAENDDHRALREALQEKVEEIQDMENLLKTLTLKERMSNDELQEARKEAISGLKDMLNDRTTFRIKRMGEVDRRPFREFFLQQCSGGDCDEMSAKLCSSWEEEVKDPHWHPFKKDTIEGRLEEVVNEDDGKLKALRNEFGADVYNSVANALLEMNNYNSSGMYAVPEIWNTKEERKASLQEIISYLIMKWKTSKQTNKRKRKVR